MLTSKTLTLNMRGLKEKYLIIKTCCKTIDIFPADQHDGKICFHKGKHVSTASTSSAQWAMLTKLDPLVSIQSMPWSRSELK